MLYALSVITNAFNSCRTTNEELGDRNESMMALSVSSAALSTKYTNRTISSLSGSAVAGTPI